MRRQDPGAGEKVRPRRPDSGSRSFRQDLVFKDFRVRVFQRVGFQRSVQMPRGGARVGSGRKPKTAKKPAVPNNLVGIDGGRTGDLSATPPADLPSEQHGFWKSYAPLAIEAGTLTPQTAGSFRLLCELDAEKTATKATLDKDGRTYIKVSVDGAGVEHDELKAHPLTGSYRQLAQRVEALMARFLLAPFGKPLPSAGKKKQVANPWAAIAAKR